MVSEVSLEDRYTVPAWIFHGYGRGGLRLTGPKILIMGSVR
jgi:hypothetical protein